MNADLIITSDWHLQEGQLTCRTDDFWQAQANAVAFVRDLQLEHGCPVVIAGDLFEKAKSSPFLEAWAIENLPDQRQNQVLLIPGQHDLPNHSMELYPKSSLHVLEAAGRVEVLKEGYSRRVDDSTALYGYPWGAELKGLQQQKGSRRRIAICHVLTWTKKRPWAKCEADGAKRLLKKMSGFDLVVTGDNHQSFVTTIGDRILLNPGSLTRTTATEIDHTPTVFLWNAEDNLLKPVYLPIKKGVVSREHIASVEERDERIESFVDRLDSDVEIGLSFERNLKRFFASKKNKVSKPVQDLVWEAVE